MLKRLQIVQKFTFYFLVIGGIVLLTLSIVFYAQFKSALLDRTLLQLSSVNTLKKDHIIDEIKARKSQLGSVVAIADTANKEHLKAQLTRIHLHNALMFSAKKKLVWAHKETNDDELSQIILSLQQTGSTSELITMPNSRLNLVFSYKLSDGMWVVLIERATDIENILYERTGLGTTGESYIVGTDSVMRTKSRFYPNRSPNTFLVNSPGVASALDGQSGKSQFPDYRGIPVLSAYRDIEIDQIKWAVLSEIDVSEAMQPVIALRNRLLIISIFTLALLLMMSWVLAQRIAQPIVTLKETILEVAKGNLPENTEMATSKDEIGQMTDAVDHLISGLRKVILFAQNIGYGNFEADYTPLSNEDQLGKSLTAMLDQLRHYQYKTAQFDLRNKKALIEGQESERARLARDIHDGIGPLLTAIKLQIAALDEDGDKKQALKAQLDNTIQEVRRISNNLMPAVLLDFGVGAALKNLIDGISKSSDIKFVFKDDLNEDNSNISHDKNIAIYRIVQEAINNALKHAEATEIRISLTEFTDRVSVYVSDNGKGFNYTPERVNELNTHGLRNMRDRVKLLGGEFEFSSTERGTTIEFELPV